METQTVRIALLLSLALNLFLAGLVGAWVVTRHHALGDPLGQRPIARRAAAGLTPDHRDAFVSVLRSVGKGVRLDNQAARRLRAGAWASLADANADPAAIKTALAQASAINRRSRATVESAIVDFAAGLPPTERAAFGQAMSAAIMRQDGAGTLRR